MSRTDYLGFFIVFALHVPLCGWLAVDADRSGVAWAWWLNVLVGGVALFFAAWAFRCWRRA